MVVAKAWDEQCERVLGVTLEENVRMIAESVALVRAGKEVVVDCEHFRRHAANPAYAVQCAAAAAEGGRATWCCARPTGATAGACEAATRDVVEALRGGLLERCGVARTRYLWRWRCRGSLGSGAARGWCRGA